jgi:CrcB protein
VTDERVWRVDPDVDPDAGPFPGVRRSRLPRIHAGSVVAVAAGGFVGGLVRYLVGLAWPTPAGSVPWAIFTVNTAGAFILALLVVLVMEVLPPTTYLRPAIGTGFCGALTTFSSVMVGLDQLISGGSPLVALVYLLVSLVAGVAAVALGVFVARGIAKRGRPA